MHVVSNVMVGDELTRVVTKRQNGEAARSVRKGYWEILTTRVVLLVNDIDRFLRTNCADKREIERDWEDRLAFDIQGPGLRESAQGCLSGHVESNSHIDAKIWICNKVDPFRNTSNAVQASLGCPAQAT